MAKHLPAAYPRQAVAAQRPAVRWTCGIALDDNDGRIVDGHRSMALTDGFVGYATPSGARLHKEDGKDRDLIFMLANGDMRGRRFVDGVGYHDSTRHVEKYLGATVVGRRFRFLSRLLRFGAMFFSRLGPQTLWTEATHPYDFLDLRPNCEVVVQGASLRAGDTPVGLGNGWQISHVGPSVVCIHDESGVRDRFRYEKGQWQRLVTKTRTKASAVAAEIRRITKAGEIEFAAPNAPPIIAPGRSLVMHLSGEAHASCTSEATLATPLILWASAFREEYSIWVWT